MSDDKYVPEHEMVRECWIDWSAGCGIGRKTAYEEFERFISEVKADALREVADDLYGGTPSRRVPTWSVNRSIRVLADRIEGGVRP